MAGLVLPGDVAESLRAHAQTMLPNEACALLGGDAATGAVTSLHVARNAAASPHRFELEAADLVRLVHAIEHAGEEMVAIFHSHPAGPAGPSAADIREARYPAFQLVASIAGGEWTLRAWRIDGNVASEVSVEVVSNRRVSGYPAA